MKTTEYNPVPAKKVTRQRPATEKRRRDIIDAALACFLDNGVTGTSTEQTRIRANASHGSIYHLLRSKDEIASTLFVEGMQTYHEKIVRAVKETTTVNELIRAIVAAHLQDAISNPLLSIYLT